MVLNIYSTYQVMQSICDKVRQGYLSPDEWSQFLDLGQQSLYTYFKPLKEAGDDEATTALIPFKKSVPLTSASGGLLTYPADYGNTEAIYETIDGRTVSMNTVLHVELAAALDSYLYPIAEYPRYLEESTGIQIYPAVTHIIDLHYLSRPTTPVIGFTVVGNDIVYDPLTSVQLQFSNNYWTQIIQKALAYAGINLSAQEVAAASQMFYQENPPNQS